MSMKTKLFLVVILVGGLLFVGFNVFSTTAYSTPDLVSYSRTAGYTIENPITISVEVSQFPRTYTFTDYCASQAKCYWGLTLSYIDPETGYEEYESFGTYVASTTLSIERTIAVPLREYSAVNLVAGVNETDENWSWISYEEWDIGEEDDPIFEVVAVSWLPFTDNFIGGIIGYVRGWLGSGIFPLLAMFIGIPLAFVVIKRVIALLPKK